MYEPIERALQHALGLKKIYVLVSETTASASEMVINGLRGLDIEVNLIGMPTNGKNVGMEGVVRSFHNYDFLLFPVSFYIENAKGFRDYSDGFTPDVQIDDSAIYPGEFGTMMDQLGYLALQWIKTDNKPQLPSAMPVDEIFRRSVGKPARTACGRSRDATRERGIDRSVLRMPQGCPLQGAPALLSGRVCDFCR